MADINDLLNFANAQQPTKFASAFDEIMGQKIVDSLEDRKVYTAQGMFASDEEDFDDDEDLDVEFDEDDYVPEDDDDDLDWDIDDLEDEDLEGFEDDDEDA